MKLGGGKMNVVLTDMTGAYKVVFGAYRKAAVV